MLVIVLFGCTNPRHYFFHGDGSPRESATCLGKLLRGVGRQLKDNSSDTDDKIGEHWTIASIDLLPNKGFALFPGKCFLATRIRYTKGLAESQDGSRSMLHMCLRYIIRTRVPGWPAVAAATGVCVSSKHDADNRLLSFPPPRLPGGLIHWCEKQRRLGFGLPIGT